MTANQKCDLPVHPETHSNYLRQTLSHPVHIVSGYIVNGLILGTLSAIGWGMGYGGNDLVHAQTSTINNNQPGTIGNNSSNNVIAPTSNQNANQNQSNPNNIINVPNIYPLQTPLVAPVNTENDFGLNFSLGMNTLDSRNVTAFIGVIYQPGRTDSHLARMNRLNKETAILEQQKKLLEAQVSLLQQQAEEARLRVEQLRQSQNQGSNAPANLVRPNTGSKSMWSSFVPLNVESSETNSGFSTTSTSNFNTIGSMGGMFPTVTDGR
jgi:hypothetical protein